MPTPGGPLRPPPCVPLVPVPRARSSQLSDLGFLNRTAQGGEHDGQLYLARQVEVQPVFNREFIAELSDVASANLLSLENLLAGDATKRRGPEFLADGTGIEGEQTTSRWTMMGPDSAEALEDLEEALVSAVKAKDGSGVTEILKILMSPANTTSNQDGRNPVSRILWRAVLAEEPAHAMNGVNGAGATNGVAPDGAIPTTLLDFTYVDDINGRTSLHEVRLTSGDRKSVV